MTQTTISFVLAAAASGALAAVFGYLVARRQSSGRIDTSTAEALWKEAQAQREHLSGRLEQIETRMVTLEKENRTVHEELLAVRESESDCKREIERMAAQMTLMRSDHEERGRDLARLKARLER